MTLLVKTKVAVFILFLIFNVCMLVVTKVVVFSLLLIFDVYMLVVTLGLSAFQHLVSPTIVVDVNKIF